jgi:autotransporter-associated beta strand protein
VDANWLGGVVFADNQGAWFDDTATVTAVNLNGVVAPNGFYIYTNVVGTAPNTVTNFFTNQPSYVPGIVFNNSTKNYLINGAGRISGLTGIYKTGTGTLTILGTNDYIGTTIIDKGTLVISNNTTAAISSLGTAATGVGGGASKNNIMIDGGTLSYIGLTNVSLGHAITILPGGATVNVAVANWTVNIDKTIVGYAGSLTKNGPGDLQLNSGTDVYPGGTIVNGGNLKLFAVAAGTGPITLNNTSGLSVTNNNTFTNDFVLNGPTLTFQITGTSTNTFNGTWSGGGSLTFSNINPVTFVGDISGLSGTISFGATSGSYLFNNKTNSNVCTGSAGATFDLGSGSAVLQNFNGSNITYNLGGLSGGPNTVLTGRSATNSADLNGETYSIGANGVSTAFYGKITNGLPLNAIGTDPVSIFKTGSGRLSLNGVSTYTGNTTVNNGTLGGNGSIASPLTVSSGGTLAAGTNATAIGTFTISNTATLGGTTLLKLNQALSPSNDMIVVTGTLTGGGALVVTNIGGAITGTPTFQLFNKAVSGFSATNLPALPVGYAWTNNVAVNGSISVVATVNTGPTNIAATVSGNTLTLTWPSDHTGWRLLAQTNALSIGLTMPTNTWTYVNGSSSTNSVTMTIDATKPAVFYRLIYP